MLGRYVEELAEEQRPICQSAFSVKKQENFVFTVPEKMRGAYVFFYLEDGEDILCRNYMQRFIEGADEDSEAQEGIIIPPGSFRRADGDYVQTMTEGNGACAVCICGEGILQYDLTLKEAVDSGTLILEAGAREGKNAVQVTDEKMFGTQIEIYWDDDRIAMISPEDDPSDERALFSNGVQGGKPYNYRNTGRLGYGERFEVMLPKEKLSGGRHTLSFVCGKGGMTIYGRYTGRYGFDPAILCQKG